jgi:hypothetical protein
MPRRVTGYPALVTTLFRVGDRVETVRGGLLPGPWRPGAVGTVAEVISEREGRTTCLVDFDQPQLDAEGDGPYSASEIDTKYLRATP